MMTAFLVTIAAILRICGAFHDALSARKVGWWYWHTVNWVRRDLIIAVIVWLLHGLPWESWGALNWWLIWIGANIAAHKFFYWAGQEISFWLLTKRIY